MKVAYSEKQLNEGWEDNLKGFKDAEKTIPGMSQYYTTGVTYWWFLNADNKNPLIMAMKSSEVPILQPLDDDFQWLYLGKTRDNIIISNHCKNPLEAIPALEIEAGTSKKEER